MVTKTSNYECRELNVPTKIVSIYIKISKHLIIFKFLSTCDLTTTKSNRS